jgi:hypothetical protein
MSFRGTICGFLSTSLLVGAIGCGGGGQDDLTAQIKSMLLGTWNVDVKNREAGARFLLHYDESGWFNIDQFNPAQGPNWCRNYTNWDVLDARDDGEFVSWVGMRTYSVASCGIKPGDERTFRARAFKNADGTFGPDLYEFADPGFTWETHPNDFTPMVCARCGTTPDAAGSECTEDPAKPINHRGKDYYGRSPSAGEDWAKSGLGPFAAQP